MRNIGDGKVIIIGDLTTRFLVSEIISKLEDKSVHVHTNVNDHEHEQGITIIRPPIELPYLSIKELNPEETFFVEKSITNPYKRGDNKIFVNKKHK